MLECIKFGDCKVKKMQIGNEWFAAVRHIGIALDVSSDTLRGIIRNHLPQQYKFPRKQIGIDSSYDGSKLITTIPGACRVILGSTHPDRYDVLDFLVERHNHLQDQAWEAQKTEHVALDDSIPVAKNYREQIYFVFKLGEAALLGSKKIAYEYTCISLNGINNFREKHPGSIIILKIVHASVERKSKHHVVSMLLPY